MGDVVPIAGDSQVAIPRFTKGQELFAAIVEELQALGMMLPRRAIAVAVTHGKEALVDGVDPDCVLIGCLVALRQGKGRFATDYISEVVAVKSGNHLSRKEYEQLLSSYKKNSSPAVAAEREAVNRALKGPNA